MSFATTYLLQAQKIIENIDSRQIERIVEVLLPLRETGRLFILGSGGGAAHASHAVCDFRKICGFQAYCPSDNVAELTARVNDEGWDTSLSHWLVGSKLCSEDALLVFSVGGGSLEKNVSPNLVRAIELAKSVGAKVTGIVGRDGGYTAAHADAAVIIPTVDESKTTPHTEAFQAVVWHLIVSHPKMQLYPTKWESTDTTPSVAAVKELETVKSPSSLTVKIFADSAEKHEMLILSQHEWIAGFTTNPTLMRRAGISDYSEFALDMLRHTQLPICFEVFSDDLEEMERQAREIASWGPTIYVKVPITNSLGTSTLPVIKKLSESGIKVNVTAVMTKDQITGAIAALQNGCPSFLSIFAGRIADTGRDPVPLIKEAVQLAASAPQIEIIWASPREVLNIFQANEVGCHAITVTGDILQKLSLLGKDLQSYSLETVRMFHDDAKAAGFDLLTDPPRKSGTANRLVVTS